MDLEIIKKLTSLNKNFYTVEDLEKVLGLPRASLLVTLTRLVKRGTLFRVKRGMYSFTTGYFDVEKSSCEIYQPSYISFETALSKYGILSQIPYTTTLATARNSKKIMLNGFEAEYSHVKTDLFWGYELKNGLYIAEPEKALLDELYLVSRGKRHINYEEFDLSIINKAKFKQYLKRFPKNMLSKIILPAVEL